MRTICCLLAAGAMLATAFSACAADDDEMLFISPCGKPYTAKKGEPYPSDKWFKATDTNHDGKLDLAEFRAEADGFFTELDRNKDGVIGPQEVTIYERFYVPEILQPYSALDGKLIGQPGFALANMQMGDIDPGGASESSLTPRQRLNTNQGAVQFSFFREPEPVRAADRNFDYLVSRQEFKDQADRHFKALDANEDGFITPDELPMTPAQKAMRRFFK